MSKTKDQLKDAGESNRNLIFDESYPENNKISIDDGGMCTSILDYTIQEGQKVEFKFSVWNDACGELCTVTEFGIGLTTEPENIDLLNYPKKAGVVYHTGLHDFFRNLNFSNMRNFKLPDTKVFEYNVNGQRVKNYSLNKQGALGKNDKCKITIDLTTDEDNVCMYLGSRAHIFTVPPNETYYIWIYQGSEKDCTHNVELLEFTYM